MIALLHKVVRLLNRQERRRLALLLTLMPIAAIGEMGGVATMLPFLRAVVDRTPIGAPGKLAAWLGLLDATGPKTLVLTFGVGAFLVLLSTNVLIVSSLSLQLRFCWLLHHRLSAALLGKYLREPYAYFLSRNSGALTANLVLQVEHVTEGFMIPALVVFNRAVASLALITYLAATEPLLAFTAVGLISGIYGVFYVGLARRRLAEIGLRKSRINRERVQLVSEAFGGIKDVKLLHAEETFVDAFRPLSLAYSRDQIVAALIGASPRYIVEAVAFGGVVLISLALASSDPGSAGALPLLGTFAFAGYRLMPSIQNGFTALMQLRTHRAAFESLDAEVGAWDPSQKSAEPHPAQATTPLLTRTPLSPVRSVELRQLTFRYPRSARPALDDIQLTLRARSTTGIVGPTGSGKTTFVDVLLGLLRPERGDLCVDDAPITGENLERWQASIGYVPQHIYLSDASIEHNVAFGVPGHEIDRAAVEEACRAARIHDFITEELPEGYATVVGERGVRLSGGERQRIGIARALYRRPEVLVLDEATSALDLATEEQVMLSIRQLAGKKTIIMIAHREATLRDCDVIYRIARGRVELVGPYSSLARGKGPPLEAAV